MLWSRKKKYKVKHRHLSNLLTDEEAYKIWKECGGWACDYYEYAMKVIQAQMEKDYDEGSD